jgi:hypothetical protein
MTSDRAPDPTELAVRFRFQTVHLAARLERRVHKEDTQNQNAAEKRRAISVANEKTFKSCHSDQFPAEHSL